MRKATNPNDILCPLCLDNFTNPRSLPCLHTYCEKCLDDYIKNSFKRVGKTFRFECPTCEKETLLPSSRTRVDAWAAHFPNDRILMSMLPENTGKVKQLCQSCIKGAKQEPADSFCTNCKKVFCKDCVVIHNHGKQNHLIIALSDPRCRADMYIGISEKVKCSRHIHKDLEYFCRSHKQTCCSDCIFDDHGACEEKLKLKKHSRFLLKSRKTEHLTKHINELVDYLDTRTQINKGAISKMESETQSMVDEIDSLICLLQNAKSRIVKEREELLETESLTLHERNIHFRSLKASLINSLKSYKEVCKYGDNYECFVILHKLEEHIVHCENILQNKYPEVRQLNFGLQYVSMFDVLRTIDVNRLAEINFTETIRPAPPVPRISRSSPLQLAKVGGLQPKLGIFLTALLWLQDPFRTTNIKLIERLPGNKMIVMGKKGSTDFGYVLNLQTNRVMAHYCPFLLSSPWDLCVIDTPVPLVVVTFPFSSKLIILSITCIQSETATISTSKEFDKKPHKFYGVSALSPHHFAASAEYGDNIVLSIVSVAELRLVKEHHVCKQRRSWFSHGGSYLTTSKDKSRAYISCAAGSSESKPAVYCLSVETGENIFKYQHPDLTYPSKLCVDGQDNIYICNSINPGSIHHITDEGELIQIFHSGIPKEPIAICFDEEENELFVASRQEGEIARLRLEQ